MNISQSFFFDDLLPILDYNQKFFSKEDQIMCTIGTVGLMQ